MELIYAYIEKYRCFEPGGISFSDKFTVTFDPEQTKLTIERNENYVETYPGNIVGVSAILGKNASGKSSLLDLIGKKIEDRHRFHELDGSSYFLLYYYGENSDNEEIFILETNHLDRFYTIFENHTCFTKPILKTSTILSNAQKQNWYSVALKHQGNHNIFIHIGNIRNHPSDEYPPSFIDLCAIVQFDNYSGAYDKDYFHSFLCRERFHLQNIQLYKQINFLINHISEDNSIQTMFKEQVYHLNINFSNYATFLSSSDQADPSNIFSSFEPSSMPLTTNPHDILLSFLEKYAHFIYINILLSEITPSDSLESTSYSNLSESYRDVIDQLTDIRKSAASSCYDEIKSTYLKQIGLLIEFYSYPESASWNLPRFFSAFTVLEDFLLEANDYGIKYKYDFPRADLDIQFSEHSNLQHFSGFFNQFIKVLADKSSSLISHANDTFMTTDILYLSDGEKENLDLFATINECIRTDPPEKKQYILLFDEIERSMHPEMCRRLISDLIKFLGQYAELGKEFQIIIASHSPFIAGDLKPGNVVLLNREGERTVVSKPRTSPFGQNIHTLLKDQFFLDQTFGKYALSIIDLVNECLSKDSLDQCLKRINEFLSNNGTYPAKELKDQEHALIFLEQTINSIGEPILQNCLRRNLKSFLSRSAKIEYYRKKIAELEQGGEK